MSSSRTCHREAHIPSTPDARHASEAARQQLIEELMALEGRAAARPVAYRLGLNMLSLAELSAKREKLLEGL